MIRFGIKFSETDIALTFAWKEVVELATDVIFFGPPFDAVRNYARMFHDCWTVQYARQIFFDIAKETTGDSFSSYLLSSAYKDTMLYIYANESKKLATIDRLLTFNETDVQCV